MYTNLGIIKVTRILIITGRIPYMLYVDHMAYILLGFFIFMFVVRVTGCGKAQCFQLHTVHFLSSLAALGTLYYVEKILFVEHDIGELLFVLAFFILTFRPFTALMDKTIFWMLRWKYTSKADMNNVQHEANGGVTPTWRIVLITCSVSALAVFIIVMLPLTWVFWAVIAIIGIGFFV